MGGARLLCRRGRRLFDIDDLLDHHGRGLYRCGRAATADIGDMAKPALLQNLLHALDGETIAVEQRADALEQVDILGPVIAASARPLDGAYLRETAFPETQHMLWHVKFNGNFPDVA